MRFGILVVGLLAVAACSEPPPAKEDASPAEPTPEPWFEPFPEGPGFRYVSGHDGRHLFPEIIGGGAALFDMDGDGDLDAYLVQGGSLREPGGAASANRLYRNDGTGRFVDVTEGSGADDRGYGMGVAAGDYDDDGDTDLYVTNLGRNTLLRNDGDGRFADVTDESGAGGDSWGVSATFVDVDADGDLDLFVTNYVHWSETIEQDCFNNSGVLDYCLPTNYGVPARDLLLRNDGGRFVDVSESAGLGEAFGNGLGTAAADFDGDGRQDVFVANDTTLNQLWLNRGGAAFVDEALLRGCALDEHGLAKAGMGVAIGDLDDDADPDLIVVNMDGQTDSVFRNDDGFFSDQTGAFGLGRESRGYTRFGIGLIDFDHDGRLDLYEANGKVVKSPEPETDDPYAEPDMLFRGGPDGRFEAVAPVGGTAERVALTSRGAAFGDVDGDGGVDVLVVHRDGPVRLLRNLRAGNGNWIRIRALEAGGRDAIGANVSLGVGNRRISRDVRAGYSYASSSDPAVHAGLGDAERAVDVRIRWVDGAVEACGDLAANRTHVLRRGACRGGS